MMISVPGEWDSYRLDELQAQLRPGYRAQHLVINLAGSRHLTDTLLASLLELRNEREVGGLEPAQILVNSAFVRKLLELSGFDRLFRVYDAVELLVPRAA